MKTLLILALLVSCGKKTVTKLIENPYDNSGNDARLDELERKISELENQASGFITQLNELEDESSDNAQFASLLQTQINNNLASIVALQSQDSIVSFYDPCNDGPGYDEVIMKTKSGKYIAYFENGSNRFLTILSPGNYRTTDQQACNFTI